MNDPSKSAVWNATVLLIGVLAATLVVAGSAFAAPTGLYVATSGDDSWSGAKSAPLATLQGAVDRIAALSAGRLLSRDGVVVWVEGGVYRSRLPLTLNASEGIAVPIAFRAYKNQRPIIDGGAPITNWQVTTDPAILNRLDPEARGQVRQADLRAKGISDFGSLSRRGFGAPMAPSGLELFFRDAPAVLARWPRVGQWATIASTPAGQDGGVFGYVGDEPAKWMADDDVWVHGYWTYDWADTYEKVARIDPARHEIYTVAPHGVFGYTPQHRWYALNILEELNTPNEWYLDRRTGILYFWPPTPIARNDAEVSVVDGLVRINGVSNVTLDGFTLENCRGNAIEIDNARHDVARNCLMRDIGEEAIVVSGSTDSGVDRTEIAQTGDGGVTLDDGDRKTLAPGRCFVTDCRIHDYSRWDRTYRPAVQIDGVGNLVAHNAIFDAPHEGIALGGNDNTIEYNEIHHVCLETGDAGAFYMGRDWTMRGNVVRFNYFHDIGGGTGLVGYSDTVAVYLDDTACGTLVQGNLFVRCDRTVLLGGGRDVTIENNVFDDCKIGVSVDARGIGWAAKYLAPGGGWQMQEKLAAVGFDRPPYSTRYPQLANVLTVRPDAPYDDIVAKNIVFNCEKPFDIDSQVGDGWIHFSNLVDVDPRFVNAAKGDYRLGRTSPASGIGFAPLPLDQIGPRKVN
jgi:hypothetical protein